MKAEKINAGLAIAHLYRRFQAPEYFSVHEMKIGDSDAWRVERRADFIAARMWGSGFGNVLGFEVKVSRSDFLHEMKQPDKRGALEATCNACYFVAPKGVLVLEELPEGWGWLEVQAQGLRMRREAKHRSGAAAPRAMHTLMKRMLDDRWHDRAKRPAVYDIPKPLWKLAGLEVTPAQLLEAAREIFKDEVRLAHSKGVAEGREAARGVKEQNSEHADALVKAICRATGLNHWNFSDPAELEKILKAGFNRDSREIHGALATAKMDVSRLLDRLTNLENRVAPPEPAVPILLGTGA